VTEPSADPKSHGEQDLRGEFLLTIMLLVLLGVAVLLIATLIGALNVHG
jgi:hypothetical protein